MGIGYNPKIVTSGLVLALDAANTKSYPGSGTTWTDLSGTGNHGTLTNGPTFSSNNKGYFNFDFTDDVVNVNDSNSLSFTNNIFTFNIWVYFNSVNVVQGVIGKRGWEYSIHTTGSNSLLFYTWNPGGSDVYSRSATIEANKWYNFVFTANGTTASLYQNGVFLSSVNKSGNDMGNTGVGLTIGRGGQASTGDAFMNGRVAAAFFYNTHFSNNDVQQNFNAMRGRYGI